MILFNLSYKEDRLVLVVQTFNTNYWEGEEAQDPWIGILS